MSFRSFRTGDCASQLEELKNFILATPKPRCASILLARMFYQHGGNDRACHKEPIPGASVDTKLSLLSISTSNFKASYAVLNPDWGRKSTGALYATRAFCWIVIYLDVTQGVTLPIIRLVKYL